MTKKLQITLVETVENTGYIDVPDTFTLEEAIQYAYKHPEEVNSPRHEENVVDITVECDGAHFVELKEY